MQKLIPSKASLSLIPLLRMLCSSMSVVVWSGAEQPLAGRPVELTIKLIHSVERVTIMTLDVATHPPTVQ